MLITGYKQIRVEDFQKVYFMVDIEREIEKETVIESVVGTKKKEERFEDYRNDTSTLYIR